MRRLRLSIALLALSWLSATALANEWIVLRDQGKVCERLSQTYLMRDSQYCGSPNRIFCMTPIRCFLPGSDPKKQVPSYGMAGCRAHVNTVGPEGCMPLQECADFPDTEFEYTHNLWKWKEKEPCWRCGNDDPKFDAKGKGDGSGPAGKSHKGDVKG